MVLSVTFGGQPRISRANYGNVALALGCIVGLVELVAVRSTDGWQRSNTHDDICGDFSPGRYAWQRSGFKRFERPIPCLGRQGFFEVPDALMAAEIP